MKSICYISLSLIFLFGPSHAKDLYTKSEMEALLKDKVLARSDVDSFKENDKRMQTLDIMVKALHRKKCKFAMKKMGAFENYSQYSDFITESSYNEDTQRLRMKVDSSFIPKPILLDFKIEKPRGEGVFKYTFDNGFLKGLKGELTTKDVKKRCFIASGAKWKGPDSPYPNMLLEFFTKTLSKIMMERLLKVSQTL